MKEPEWQWKIASDKQTDNDTAAARADTLLAAGEPSVDPGSGEVGSDTGELWRSWKKRFPTRPLTRSAGGFATWATCATSTGNRMGAWATVVLPSRWRIT